MKQTVFRYGIYSTLLLLGLGMINLFIIARAGSYAVQEVAGYLSILLSMIFIFFGVRHYRDHVNKGTLGFGEGLKVGVLILLIPSVFFGLFDLLYTEVINPSWKEDYYNHYLAGLKSSVPADQFDAEKKKMEAQKEMFSNPVIQFLLMSLTVFIIGFIVTIISSLALRRQASADR
ncbi:MAG: DUF4199 domain-containing protein [Chitinophagaceae bacterium]|nr:DUF4199 domain-containing protein [Chitinophagaceae bacterium]